MTATHVDGVEVVYSEPATSHIKSRDGQPVQYRQMVRLLLADGRELFGCVHCDYTHASLNSVRPHLNAHRVEKRPSPVDMSVTNLLAATEHVVADRDAWKARALKAERSLRALKKALS